MNSENKLTHEIEASKEVIDMVELWLNKAKEPEPARDHISVIGPRGGAGYKKIIFKNINPEKIKKLKTIVKYLMNFDATDFEWDEDLENYDDLDNKDCENFTSSSRYEDWGYFYVSHDFFFVNVVVMYVDKVLLDYNVMLVYFNMLFFSWFLLLYVALKKKYMRGWS